MNDDPIVTPDPDPADPANPPVAGSYDETTPEDTPITSEVVATDPDGDDLTYTLNTPPANGTVVVNPDGTYTYTPDEDFTGDDSFIVTVDDGNGGTVDIPVNITVTPVNDIPVAVNDSATLNEDASINIDVIANDTQLGDTPTTVTAITQPTNGTAVLEADGTVTYTPNADYNGADSFTYTITDANGDTSTATVNLTVNPVNDAPIINHESTAIAVDERAVISLTGLGYDFSDIDAGSGIMTLTLSSASSYDIITADAGATGVTIDSGSGTNNLVVSGTLAQLNSFIDGSNSATLTFQTADGSIPSRTSTSIAMTLNDNGNSPDTPLTDISTIDITINPVNELILGSSGDDAVYGQGGGDILVGGGGNDTMYGSAGNDIIYGDSGYVRNGQFEFWYGNAAAPNSNYSEWYDQSSVDNTGWTQSINTELGGWAPLNQVTNNNNSVANNLSSYTNSGGRWNIDLHQGGLQQSVYAIAGETYTLSWVQADGPNYSANTRTHTTNFSMDGVVMATISVSINSFGNAVAAPTLTVTAAGTAMGITGFTATNIGDTSSSTTNIGLGNLRSYSLTFEPTNTEVIDLKWTASGGFIGDNNGIRFDDVSFSTTNAGSDTIYGGDGNDLIFGMGGDDILTGGTGSDTFFYTTAMNNGTDVITDFVVGEDKIVLGDLINLSGLTATGENPTTLNNADQAITTADLFNSDKILQATTWNDATHTLTFGTWGGSVTIEGLASGYTLNTLVSSGILQLTSDGFDNTSVLTSTTVII